MSEVLHSKGQPHSYQPQPKSMLSGREKPNQASRQHLGALALHDPVCFLIWSSQPVPYVSISAFVHHASGCRSGFEAQEFITLLRWCEVNAE